MRSNYSREERQRIIAEYIQSGKSQTAFAPEYGIRPNKGNKIKACSTGHKAV